MKKTGYYSVDLRNLPRKPTWREALKALAGPAVRLHRYRDLHTAMLEEAADKMDHEDCR